jgi:hypothetical protein
MPGSLLWTARLWKYSHWSAEAETKKRGSDARQLEQDTEV